MKIILRERWKPVVEFENYKVSNYGRIKNSHKILKTFSYGDSYVKINLTNKDSYKKLRVHCLVARVFLGPCPQGKEVNHKDGIKKRNYVWNLEYITHLKNIEHAVCNGFMNTKLTKKDILLIRRFVNFESQWRVAQRFNVSNQNISLIVNKKIWKHLG